MSKKIEEKFEPTGLLKPSEKITILPNPRGRQQEGRHVVSKAPLFRFEPMSGAPIQGALGDCSLIASMEALLNLRGGPKYIQQMMKDNGDGTVTARLYRESKFSEITVEKSLRAQEWKRESFFSLPRRCIPKRAMGDDLWVAILEKAFIAFACEGDYLRFEGEFGGLAPDLVWKTLTGQECIFIHVGEYRASKEGELLTFLLQPNLLEDSIQNLMESVRKLDSKQEDDWLKDSLGQALKVKKLFSPEEFKIWCGMVTKEAIERYQDFLYDCRGRTVRFHEAMRVFHQIVAQPKEKDWSAAQREVFHKVSQWLMKENIFPGKRGLGEYTEKQKELYQKIKQALAADKALLAETLEKVKEKKEGQGLAGEDMCKGLVGKHAYTVLRCEEKPTPDGKSLRLGVWLRNPWNNYGRVYKYEGEKCKAFEHPAPAGVFWLDLSDLTKRFKKISILNSPVILAQDLPTDVVAPAFRPSLT